MVEVNTKLVSSHKEPALARSSFCASLWAFKAAIAISVSLTTRALPRLGAVKESPSLVRVNCRRTCKSSRSRSSYKGIQGGFEGLQGIVAQGRQRKRGSSSEEIRGMSNTCDGPKIPTFLSRPYTSVQLAPTLSYGAYAVSVTKAGGLLKEGRRWASQRAGERTPKRPVILHASAAPATRAPSRFACAFWEGLALGLDLCSSKRISGA